MIYHLCCVAHFRFSR